MVTLARRGEAAVPGEELVDGLAPWRALGEAVPDILLLVDHRGVVLYGNHAPPSFRIDDIVGSSVFDMAPIQTRDELRDSLQETFERQATRTREIPVQHPDGTVRWYATHTGPVYHEQCVTAAVILARDITDRKLAEEQLRQHQKLEALGQLASEVAHDFHTILAVIGTSNELLTERVGADPECAIELAAIRAAAQRGTAFTRQLLRYARNQHSAPSFVDVHTLIADVAAMLRQLLGSNVNLYLQLEATEARVHARRGQLDQIMMNLILNARDALPSGGRITVSTATITNAEGVCLRLAVEDDGTGMDATTCSRAFEPLFTTKDPDKGTGLGLSTVHAIVTQLGGQVSAQSQRGCGSRFEVTLPTAQAVRDSASG